MRIIEIEQGTEEWQSLRSGKITGTKIAKTFGKNRKDGTFDYEKPQMTFYEIIAERIADPDEDGLGSNRERGHRLESEAIDRAEQSLGKKFERGNVWQFDENHIGSPDGYTADLTEAIEVKCLASARHLKAIYEERPPEEYRGEYLNYFNNPNLQRLHIALYDPRMPAKHLQLHIFTIDREDIEQEIENIRNHAHTTEQLIEQAIDWLMGNAR